jgi:hypothetical protein
MHPTHTCHARSAARSFARRGGAGFNDSTQRQIRAGQACAAHPWEAAGRKGRRRNPRVVPRRDAQVPRLVWWSEVHQHRKTGQHQCTNLCLRHECRPLSASMVCQAHCILSGAFARSVRWHWITITRQPAPRRPHPITRTRIRRLRLMRHASSPRLGSIRIGERSSGSHHFGEDHNVRPVH